MANTKHVSLYVNVGEILGVIGGLVLGFKTIRMEEAKAGIQRRTLKEVITDDIRRTRRWYSDNFGVTKQYRHY